MILNILTDLRNPDNIPDGYSTTDMRAVLPLFITIIAIVITGIMSAIIFHLCKEKRKDKQWITPTIIMVDIIVCIVLITMCYFALQK